MAVLLLEVPMATRFWKCGKCDYRDKKEAFDRKMDPEKGELHSCHECDGEPQICPGCHCTDIFPERKFKCTGCRYIALQEVFFQQEEDDSWRDPDAIFSPWDGETKEQDISLDADPTHRGKRWKYDCSKNSRKCHHSLRLSERTKKKRLACNSKSFVQVS